jgi:hypothetical protein
MPETPDRLPGEIILASYSNTIRDRTVQRYVDNTARDSAVPLPVQGTVAYITATGQLQIFDGAEWQIWTNTNAREDLQERLTYLEGWRAAFYEHGKTQSIGTAWATYASINAQQTGDFIVVASATAEYDIALAAGLSFPAMRVQIRKNDINQEQNDVGSTGEGFHAEAVYHTIPVIGAVPGDNFSLVMQTQSSSVTSGQIHSAWIYLIPVPVGILTED